MAIIIMEVMVVVDIRTDRAIRTHGTNKTGRTDKSGQTDLTFKLDFPGNLCRAAFAILAMFQTMVGTEGSIRWYRLILDGTGSAYGLYAFI